MVSALLGQLRQLHSDLLTIARDDAEQEVMGLALPLVDAVLSEARSMLPPDSGLATQIVDLISVEQIEAGEGIRAVDASILVGQLLAALTTILAEQDAREAEAVAADQALLPEFLKLLPPDGRAVQFLRYHDFSRSHDRDDAVPLWRLYDEWTRPGQHFHSARLAPLDAEFREAVGELYNHNVQHVFETDDGSRRVYPDYDLDLETADNKFVFDAIREGDKALRRAYTAYEALVHEASLALS